MKSVSELEIGDVIYSTYTEKSYILSCLPRLMFGLDKYALIRKDGCGYCYLKDTLDEVREEIYNSGELMVLYKYGRYEEIEGR